MRLFELESGKSRELNFSKRKLIGFIQKNCSEFLSIYHHRILYRGAKNLPKIYYGRVRFNRIPHATNAEMSQKVDQKLSEAGFTALRSNSIFCSRNPHAAREFGPVYAIFPINGFTFTWSPKIRDFTRFTGLTNNGLDWVKGENHPPLDPDYLNSLIKRTKSSVADFDLSPEDYVKKYQFDYSNLSEALESDSEILIHGNYVAIDYDFSDIIQKI